MLLKGVDKDPDSVYAHYQLAETCETMKQKAEALASYKLVVALRTLLTALTDTVTSPSSHEMGSNRISSAPALTTANSADNDTAYFIRIETGGYKKPGDVQVRFTVYNSQPDAIFFAYAQSDSRRSSNLKGIRTDVRIGMPMKGNVSFTWYRTEWNVGNDSLMDRWQLDYVFRF